MNLYVFVKNNIVNRYDFLGLTEDGCPCTGAERAAALSAYISCMDAAASAASAALSALSSVDNFFDDATDDAYDNTRNYVNDRADDLEGLVDGYVSGTIEQGTDWVIDEAGGLVGKATGIVFLWTDALRGLAEQLARDLIDENYEQTSSGCLDDWESACPSE